VKALIIGGGKIGSFLAQKLDTDGHTVTVIEVREDRAQELADDLDAVVIRGDGTDVGVLEAADVEDADWLLALTGLDEVNFVACQLGLALGTGHVLARLNSPWNRATFEALEIPVVGVTRLIAEVMSREMAVSRLDRIAVIGRGQLSLVEYDLHASFPPTALRDLALPKPSVIAVVLRDGEAMVPDAETQLRPGDRITAVTTVEQEAALHRIFSEGDVSA
jgi:trk system potassium uptake protein TrkA